MLTISKCKKLVTNKHKGLKSYLTYDENADEVICKAFILNRSDVYDIETYVFFTELVGEAIKLGKRLKMSAM